MLSVKAEDADNKSLVGTGGQPKVMECLSCPHTEIGGSPWQEGLGSVFYGLSLLGLSFNP